MHKIIYRIGSSYRNPSLSKHFSFLLESQNWSLNKLRSYQLSKLKSLLSYAFNYSPFYKEFFIKNNFNPDIRHLQELEKLPTITKNDLIKENELIHTYKKFNKLFFCETSGTSGQVLTFFKNSEWDSANRASMLRGYKWHNVNPWEPNIYFWGYDIDPKQRLKVRILDSLQNRKRIFDYSNNSLNMLVKNLEKVVFIHGYSSMLYELAKIVNSDITVKPKKIKMIKGTSEQILPHYNSEIFKAFGSNIISEYGAAESGLIAYECKYGNMHINMENVIVEEENGEIIVTNLLSKSFPIIRYRLGDYIKIRSNKFHCECGIKHTIIDEVIGRVGKNVYGLEKKYPSFVLYYIFKNLALVQNLKLNYQCFQKKRGFLEISIEQPYADNLEFEIKKECFKYFQSDLVIAIQFSKVPKKFNSKFVDFISELN